MAKSKAKSEAKGVVAFRFDSETLKRLDAAVARRQEREPWRTTGRTDLVRLAVVQFLDAEEKAHR